jgi:hypothetical protein
LEASRPSAEPPLAATLFTFRTVQNRVSIHTAKEAEMETHDESEPKSKGRPRVSWNKGKLIGQKAPLKLQEIYAIRIRLQHGV